MNFFEHLCPSCGAMYQEIWEQGKTKLVHAGLLSSKDETALPTKNCIQSHDYVVFKPCGHCCPDVFSTCRACALKHEGAISKLSYPSTQKCNCHYCLKQIESEGEPSISIELVNLRANLHSNLTLYFNLQEIKTLIFSMGLDYEKIGALEGKNSFARELILYCERNKSLPQLIALCRELRPSLNWG